MVYGEFWALNKSPELGIFRFSLLTLNRSERKVKTTLKIKHTRHTEQTILLQSSLRLVKMSCAPSCFTSLPTRASLGQPRYHGQRTVSIPASLPWAARRIDTTRGRDVLKNNADWLPRVTTLRARLLKQKKKLY